MLKNRFFIVIDTKPCFYSCVWLNLVIYSPLSAFYYIKKWIYLILDTGFSLPALVSHCNDIIFMSLPVPILVFHYYSTSTDTYLVTSFRCTVSVGCKSTHTIPIGWQVSFFSHLLCEWYLVLFMGYSCE